MPRAEQRPFTVADLLYRARMISQDQLARAVGTASRTATPIGTVLVQNGMISTDALRTTALVHSLMQEKLLPEDLGIEAISRALNERINLEEALDSLGYRIDSHLITRRLSQLLAGSAMVSEADLSSAIEASYASGLPLGRVLVVRRVVPEEHVCLALTAQVLIKEGKISAQDAIDALRLARMESISIEEALIRKGIAPPMREEPIRLGQLLVSAGYLSEIDLLTAVEKSMSEEMPIGQVLVAQNLIPRPVLERALKLQLMVNNRSISKVEAITQLKHVNRSGSQAAVPRVAYFEKSSGAPAEMPDSVKALGIFNQDDWFRAIQELTLEKQNLAYKVVSQQEEMKYRLSRELHDTIIADLMMLKRYIGGDKKLSPDETIEILDHVVMQLRDICSDFAPRHFREWGLAVTVQDLLHRLSDRSGIKAKLVCELELPKLPDPVTLHIFRIIQEGLNNVEKYSSASEVTVCFECPQAALLRITISDNGKGFQVEDQKPRRSRESGGMGMGGMKERADLIRCFYPTSLQISSSPGLGSTIVLEIEIR